MLLGTIDHQASSVHSKAKKTGTFVPELDGVRGIAIAAVMVSHFFSDFATNPQSSLESVVGRFVGYGMWGVDLFFVLSGYLITGILWDSRGSGHYFRTFYMRRTLRIFPLYYAVLFVILVLVPASWMHQHAPEALQIRPVQGWLWSYLVNVYVARQGSFSIPYVSHFWTLAIEEHFYLFWPFIVGSFERRTVMRIAVVLSLLAFGSRVALHFAGVDDMASHVLTPCRLDSLCVGALFALAARGDGGEQALGAKMKLWFPISGGALALLMLMHSTPSPWDPVAVPLKGLLLALFCGAFIFTVAWSQGPSFIKWPLRLSFLRNLGKYSYGLYVFHAIISYYVLKHDTVRYFKHFGASPRLAYALNGACGIALSCLVAYASYELFEVHFLRLKRYFESGKGVPNKTRHEQSGATR